jgi:hypothetical protein
MNDFRIDADGDLDISGGDLISTESTRQHQSSIIWAGKGFYKHAPALGVGLQNYLNEHGSYTSLANSIRKELERDGQEVTSVQISNGNVTINAEYPQ